MNSLSTTSFARLRQLQKGYASAYAAAAAVGLAPEALHQLEANIAAVWEEMDQRRAAIAINLAKFEPEDSTSDDLSS